MTNNIENKEENTALTTIAIFTIVMTSSLIISTYLISPEAGNTSASYIASHIIENLTSFQSIMSLLLLIAVIILSIRQSFKTKELSRSIKFISCSLLAFTCLNVIMGYTNAIHEQEQLNCKTNGVRCEMPTTKKLAISGSKLDILFKEAK